MHVEHMVVDTTFTLCEDIHVIQNVTGFLKWLKINCTIFFLL